MNCSLLERLLRKISTTVVVGHRLNIQEIILATMAPTYLHTTLSLHKWDELLNNFEIGCIEVLFDATHPRNHWLVEYNSGVLHDRHGIVHKATVKTSAGQLLKPISKLSLAHYRRSFLSGVSRLCNGRFLETRTQNAVHVGCG